MLTVLAVVGLSLAQLDGGVTSPPTTDAGVKPFSATIYAACPDVEGAPPAYHDFDAGTWVLPDPRGARQACLLASCEEDRRYRSSPEAQTPAWVWPVSLAVDLTLKAAIAVATWGITRATTQPAPAPAGP